VDLVPLHALEQFLPDLAGCPVSGGKLAGSFSRALFRRPVIHSARPRLYEKTAKLETARKSNRLIVTKKQPDVSAKFSAPFPGPWRQGRPGQSHEIRSQYSTITGSLPMLPLCYHHMLDIET
jgi:hypothetical protein